jgi:ribonuclease P protein subunit RPR2
VALVAPLVAPLTLLYSGTLLIKSHPKAGIISGILRQELEKATRSQLNIQCHQSTNTMAKAKASKGGNTSVPQKHLHSRLSYLHQAATFLATTERIHPSDTAHNTGVCSAHVVDAPRGDDRRSSESNRLLTHLRGVSRKTQLRLTPKVKHTICKRCDSLLISGKSSNEAIVNLSKGGGKPWADLFEVRCNRCGTIKRFPVGAMIQKESNGKLKAEEQPGSDPP